MTPDGNSASQHGPHEESLVISTRWLEIDLEGFTQVLHNKGIARVALEPISNALDTDATEINVRFGQKDNWGLLEVIDDDPDGFAELRDAYTLYAPSKRRDDPTKRGRFGQGDKELVAICHGGGEVTVESTRGTIRFERTGRTESTAAPDRREQGTRLVARFRCSPTEAAEFERLMRSLLVPAPDWFVDLSDGVWRESELRRVRLTFNGEVIQRREPVRTVIETLPTKIVNQHGNLTDSQRQTRVELIDLLPGERAMIYELGVPVVEHDGPWHVNVHQKVPLNSARDNVTPGYLRKLREIMLNQGHDLLTSADMKQAWVRDAKPKANEEALTSYIHKVYGKNALIYDPSNPEANKRAIDQGRTIIRETHEDPATWNRIREKDIVKPAGDVIQTGVSPGTGSPIERDEWTPAMFNLERYTHELGDHLLGFQPDVEFRNVEHPGNHHFAAWWGNYTITFNLRYLGKQWPAEASQEDVDDLILHEFSHHDTGHDHFTDRYIHRLSRLGAKLRSCRGVL